MASILKPSPCFPSLKAWCEYCSGSSPSLNNIRRAFTLLMRTAYANIADSEEYGEALACRSYSDDASASNISIQPASVIDPGDTQNVPGILVAVPEGFQFQRRSMNPIASRSPDFASSQQITTGVATVSFTCRDKDADIACLMADLSLLVLMAARDAAFKAWGAWLLDYEVLGQSEPRLVRNEDDPKIYWYESVVTLRLSLVYGAAVSVESKRMTGGSVYAILPSGEQEGYIPCPK